MLSSLRMAELVVESVPWWVSLGMTVVGLVGATLARDPWVVLRPLLPVLPAPAAVAVGRSLAAVPAMPFAVLALLGVGTALLGMSREELRMHAQRRW